MNELIPSANQVSREGLLNLSPVFLIQANDFSSPFGEREAEKGLGPAFWISK